MGAKLENTWERHVARTEAMTNAHITEMQELDEKKLLETHRHRTKDNIKVDRLDLRG